MAKRPKPETSLIYVLRGPKPWIGIGIFVKIGRTSRDALVRLKKLQTGNHCRLVLIHHRILKHDDALAADRRIKTSVWGKLTNQRWHPRLGPQEWFWQLSERSAIRWVDSHCDAVVDPACGSGSFLPAARLAAAR
jgi:hypothetical protein